MWTPGRVAAAFATANGDPNKIPNTKLIKSNCICQMCRIQQVYSEMFTYKPLTNNAVLRKYLMKVIENKSLKSSSK
jgi:hypothetical protein